MAGVSDPEAARWVAGLPRFASRSALIGRPVHPIVPLLALTVAAPAIASPAHERIEILGVIARMEQAWNCGDFRGYMNGFSKSNIVFVSGGHIQPGWQSTLNHYVHGYGGSPERRGTLHFYAMTVDLLSPDAAMLIGHYRLKRGKRITEGVNTRLFRKIGAHWLITMNHVSAYDLTLPMPVSPPSAPAGRAGRPSN